MHLSEKLSDKLFSKALSKSNELGEKATEKDVAKVEKKLMFMNRGPVAKVWDKVLFLWDKCKSPDVPLKLKITIIGALLYLILPADVIPDYLPGFGFVDDLSVILFVSREVSKYLLPKFGKKLESKMYESCYQKIDMHLSMILKSKIITTVVTFIVNAAGCVILVTKPWSVKTSRFVAGFLFAAVFIWAVIRMIRYLMRYGKTTFAISHSVLKCKSISRGIAGYIQNEYPNIAFVFAGIEIAKNVIPEVSRIPDLPEIIKTFEDHYKKNIILTVVLFALYSALVFITKYLLMR